MTSVVGFDIGNLQSKIGLARNRGIDIIVNEVSNRATPSLVSFGPKSRTLGESAKTQETSNYKNTIGSLKRLIGRSFSDPDVQEYESKFIQAKLVDVKGSVGVEVNYLGEPQVFTATQVYAMYLGKLRDIASHEHKGPVNDVVISVPAWYTDVQRRAVLDAAEIAGLHTLRLINDTTATALGYGITKTDLPAPEEKPRNVAFVDIGHSDYQVAIVAFSKGTLTVKSTTFDRHFGGRDFDYALVRHFAEEFKGKYKIDVLSNQKACFRLLTAVERLKKILSANAAAPLNVESIMNDIDASSSLTREQLEELIAPLLSKTIDPLERALADAGLTKDEIDSVELIGGSTRVPALKTRIQEFFNRPLSFTTNQDEAVARGATLACAILSPVFKVRDFSVTDIAAYPIEICWEAVPSAPDETNIQIFNKGSTFPATKSLTLYRNQPFDVEARYADPSTLPGGINPWISKAHVKGIQATASGEEAQVKIRAKLNINGIFNFESAYTQEEIEVEAEAAPAPAEGEAPAETPAEPKKTRKVVKKDVSILVGAGSLDQSIVNELREKEGQMYATDKLVHETEDRKNALEEYIYDARDKIEGQWAAYITEEEKEKFRSLLSESEDWLYTEEGEDATKSAYVSRLDALNAVGGPVLFRFKETEARISAAKSLREACNLYLNMAQSGDAKYAHLTEEELSKVIDICANTEHWLSDKTARQAEKLKNEKPIITSEEMTKKKDEVIFVCAPIMNKPAPKVKAPATEEPKAEQQPPKPEGEAPQEPAVPETNGDAEMQESEPVVEEPAQEKANMDVD